MRETIAMKVQALNRIHPIETHSKLSQGSMSSSNIIIKIISNTIIGWESLIFFKLILEESNLKQYLLGIDSKINLKIASHAFLLIHMVTDFITSYQKISFHNKGNILRVNWKRSKKINNHQMSTMDHQ